MLRTVTYSQHIDPALESELEELLFFNTRQADYSNDIRQLIDAYGMPHIVKNKMLSIKFDKIESNTVFATFEDSLLGLFVFNRDSRENIDLVHIAIDPVYSSSGKTGSELLVVKMLLELKRISSYIKGVETITLKYGPKCVVKVRNNRG